jgi:hypothetical protein
LHTKRDEFAQAVQVIVEKDLAHNGLTLESVTISRLDQTPPTAMRGEDTVFDAQGLRTIAEITQRQRVEVERARVGVQREDLQNKAQFETIARDPQVDLARIEAEKQVRIEAAKAFGTALASARMTVWGDPETVSKSTPSAGVQACALAGPQLFQRGGDDGDVADVAGGNAQCQGDRVGDGETRRIRVADEIEVVGRDEEAGALVAVVEWVALGDPA